MKNVTWFSELIKTWILHEFSIEPSMHNGWNPANIEVTYHWHASCNSEPNLFLILKIFVSWAANAHIIKYYQKRLFFKMTIFFVKKHRAYA